MRRRRGKESILRAMLGLLVLLLIAALALWLALP